MTDRIQRRDVTSRMRRGRPARFRNVDIECQHVAAHAFRDVLEFYLWVSRVGNWRWVDPAGRVVDRQRAGRIAWNLCRDVLSAPLLYHRIKREVRAADRQRGGPRPPLDAGNPNVLFLRSDHTFHLTAGGSIGHLAGVIHGFRQLGRRVHVASTDRLPGVSASRDFHLVEPEYGLGRNLPNLPYFRFSRQMARRIEDRWEQWNPAFVYQRYGLGNYTGVLLGQARRVPYVCEYNGSVPWMERQWNGCRLYNEKLIERIELLNLRAADLVVVVSRAMKDELLRRGVEEQRILVNPNGVDPDLYAPRVDGSAARKRYGLEGKRVIGFIGTMGPWHGVEVLAEGFGRMLRRRPHLRDGVRLLLIGDGMMMPQVRRALADTGAADCCVLTGIVPQYEGPAHLAACDVLATTQVPNPDGGVFFGSPTKLFEYMAMGRAVIASRIGQLAEILEHGRNAWLVEPADAGDVAVALERLIEDQPLRARLGAAARDEVVARYTWRQHVARIVAALQARCGDVDPHAATPHRAHGGRYESAA